MASLSGTRERRNPQHLARIDLVGIGEHWPVGLEDLTVFAPVALAILDLGDFPKRVARFDGIELRLRGCGSGHNIVLHRRNSGRVAHGQHDLFGFLGRGSGAGEDHLVAVGLDIDLGDIETELFSLFLKLFGRSGRRLAASEYFRARRFDEVQKAHGFSPWGSAVADWGCNSEGDGLAAGQLPSCGSRLLASQPAGSYAPVYIWQLG